MNTLFPYLATLFGSVLTGLLTYRAATGANRATAAAAAAASQAVTDLARQEAYNQGAAFYQKTIDEQSKQIDRLRKDLDTAHVRLESLNSGLTDARREAHMIADELRSLRLAILHPSATLPGLKALAQGPSSNGVGPL